MQDPPRAQKTCERRVSPSFFSAVSSVPRTALEDDGHTVDAGWGLRRRWAGCKQIIPTPQPPQHAEQPGSLTTSSLLPGLTDAYFHLFHPKITPQLKRRFSDCPPTWVTVFDLLNSLALETPQIKLSLKLKSHYL